MGGNVRAVGHRQLAAGGGDMVSHDDHGAVVQRRILEEDIHDEPAVDIGFKTVSGGHIVLHGGFMLQNDEGSGLFGRHGADGLYQFLHALGAHDFLFDAQQPVEQLAGAPREARLHRKSVEQMADFRLEQDDEGQHTHIQEGVQQHRHHAHVQGAYHSLEDQEDHQDGHNVQYGGVSPDAPDQEKDKRGHHQDVQDVGPAEAEETEYGEHNQHSLQK